ncbi:MAG TPA: TonB-dependent receptor [Bryobacteraceae bacterium]|nr:TonB-dependent receptor [Bryobacteraceae bacterium]
MTSLQRFDKRFRLFGLRFLAGPIACILLGSNPSMAQSTFASVVGTVRDTSGAVIAKCVVALENTGTSAHRETLTDASGDYSIPNLEPGAYQVKISAPGFQQFVRQIELTARETLRADGQLAVAGQAQTVNVESTGAPVVNTDVSNIAETKSGRELIDLPIAIATRAGGSTSPISTLTSQPGVQTDASGNISVAGTKPTMLSASIDGISSTGARAASGTAGGPIAEMFPSFNSIEEIRVSEVNNAAEYGGVSDITTISKSGTNSFHGGAFENIQNSDMNARNLFAATKPVVKLNDFGAYGGGKIWKDKTFYFASYEGLRLPKQQTITESVPSVALRNGDLSAYSTPVYQPGTGTPYPNNQIPIGQISPVALNALKYLFPLPNAGAPNAIANNYVANIPTPISSDQADLRLDHVINSKMTVFARGTYKVRSVEVVPAGSPLQGSVSTPERDFGYTIAFNWIIKPTVINEIRGGFNGNHSGVSVGGSSSAQYVSEIGLQNLPQPYPTSGAIPWFNIAGFQPTGASSNANSTASRNGSSQIIDNLTWIKGAHTMKFGADYRYLTYHGQNVYDAFELGQYAFTGAVTGTQGAKNAYIGNPFGAFLLGIPDKTYLDTNTLGAIDGYDPAYAFYGQDDWKVTPRLTINFGLRYELHPRFYDHDANISNFLPNYQSIVNGQSVLGAVVIPNNGLGILSPGFAQSIAPTPILLASQAGLSNNLHITNKLDFAPRFGFAYRLTNDGKTVIRGGYGKFIEIPLGTLLGAGWAIHSADQAFFNNSITNGSPALKFPSPYPSNLAVTGSQFFQQASDLHYPEAVIQQWNLTVERDLGFNTGLRVSYDGNHGSNMGVQVNLGQLPPNTIGFNNATSLLKYPLFGEVESEVGGGIQNYDALTVALNKRYSGGLQFLASYTFARNLTDAQGFNPTTFASEAGGNATSVSDFMLDYGNVAFTRRNRFLATFLYQLPFGKGRLSAGSIGNAIVGGWELAGVALYQSGPFLTVSVPGADPAGVGFPQIEGNGRADIVSGASLYPATQSIGQWLNPAAFTVPPNNIGRFPTSPVGVAQGPGTQSISLSLLKTVQIKERYRLQLGAQTANLFNHPNYAAPNTTFNTSAFGTISALQSAEGAGPRTIQGTFRISF